MMVAHTSPFLRPAPRVVTLGHAVLNDVAAPLFALIIGVTIAVTAPSAGSAAEHRKYRLQTAAKAGVLILLGVLLDLRFSGVVIVLAHLGITVLAALPFLFARVRTLLLTAAALLVLGPGIVIWCRLHLFALLPALATQPWAMTLLDWMVLGNSYQALTLVPLVLVGLAIGHTSLHSRQGLLIIATTALPTFLMVRLWLGDLLPGAELRGGYAEVSNEAPLAVGAFAGIVLAVEFVSDRTTRLAALVVEPFAALGRLAFTVYVLHVLLLMALYSVQPTSFESREFWRIPPRGLLLQLGLIVACWAFAAAWWRWLGAGPIERVTGIVSGKHPVRFLFSRRPWNRVVDRPHLPVGPADQADTI